MRLGVLLHLCHCGPPKLLLYITSSHSIVSINSIESFWSRTLLSSVHFKDKKLSGKFVVSHVLFPTFYQTFHLINLCKITYFQALSWYSLITIRHLIISSPSSTLTVHVLYTPQQHCALQMMNKCNFSGLVFSVWVYCCSIKALAPIPTFSTPFSGNKNKTDQLVVSHESLSTISTSICRETSLNPFQ